ncbi:hypothetical protein ACFLZW_02840 [Chloroflexota bacterium]
MKSITHRLFGALLITAAIGGLALSIYGAVGVWRIRPKITQSLTESLDLVRTTLESTSEGLLITKESLKGAVASISALQDTLNTTTKTLQSTEPMVDTVVELLDEEMPQTIQATQSSLNTAQESASFIDSFLNTLSLIPGVKYNPQVPLSAALEQVSLSLNDLPGSLAEMASSLEDTGDNLQIIQVDLALMADAVHQVEVSLAQSEAVIADYQEAVTTVQDRLDKSEAQLPKLLKNIALGLTLFFVWMAVAQIGLFTQGWEMLRRDRQTSLPETSENTES